MKKIVALALCLALALALCTVAFAAPTATVGDVYDKDITAKIATVTATYVAAEDPTKDTQGSIAYYDLDDTATTYTGEYVVVAKKADADLAIYTAAGWKYLDEVTVTDYDFVGTKVGGCYAKCVFAASGATAANDIDYFTFVDLSDGKTYFAYENASAVKTLLVNGKIVKVATPVLADDMVSAHVWEVASYEADGITAATVACKTCKATAKVATYAEYLAADKTLAVQTTGIGTGYAILGAASNAGVTSAKTFDAGVALYAGMALMSVAGSAVVIGKKKEF